MLDLKNYMVSLKFYRDTIVVSGLKVIDKLGLSQKYQTYLAKMKNRL